MIITVYLKVPPTLGLVFSSLANNLKSSSVPVYPSMMVVGFPFAIVMLFTVWILLLKMYAPGKDAEIVNYENYH